MLPEFTLQHPGSLSEALDLVAAGGVPYCGGTELLAVMRMGLLRPPELVDLKWVPGLDEIGLRDGHLRIGATATHRDIGRSQLVRAHAPLLADVVRAVGNVRVRASGTVAGNLCFSEPKSDVATVLIALDASVVLRSASGSRTLSVDDFVVGAYATRLEEGELLTEVRVPSGAQDGRYLKYQTAERPTVGVALVRRPGPPGGYRLVVGAVAERPVSLDMPELAAIDPAEVAVGVEVIPDVAGAEDYKRHVTAVYVRRALTAMEGIAS